MFGPVVPPPPQLYVKTYLTKQGERLTGVHAYRLNVPTNVPVRDFWAVDVYDAETAAFIRETPVVGIDSYNSIDVNTDGSWDVYFGPTKGAVDGSRVLNDIEEIA